MVSLWADTERPPDIPNGESQSGNDPGLEALFVRNVRAISAINRDRGIRTIWLGQVLNMLHRPHVPVAQQRQVGDAYFDVPVEDFSAEDFRDRGHFCRERLG